MLSVVLYGRNDSHGYNLHKRGAISLNAIAHLLRDSDDELIFVDYNTPDDLPTFPEAIADTLTDQAKAKLRILRVRPAQHARYTKRTHLFALEPIARNVAVRRSNPANRWVLSTNTDMIFVPRQPGASLGEMVGGLEDGFYHLPRFELPEALWESLDRRDSETIIAAAGDWGVRYHLDEVVRSAGDNLFDGPGDFQLFLRDDLFKIGGFHEDMLLGWHVDANVARRMRFLRGQVRSAEPLLRGYHCDHTRQASPYHKGDRVENDPVRFVDTLERPEITEQVDSFGLAGETVEEVRLGRGSSARYLAGLAAAVPTPATETLHTAYVPEHFGELAYPLDHVLPYLLDLVSCIPIDSRIGYLGARPDTLAAFAKGWAAMGGEHPPLVPQDAAWLHADTAPLAAKTPTAKTLADWAAQADVFVFEVGAESGRNQRDLSDEERARLWLVNHGMATAFTADAQRQREGAPPRRAIVVNAIHNSFEAQLFRHLSVTLTPFSSRIRHGFIVDPDRPAVGHPAWRRAANALGRERPLSAAEVAAAARIAKVGLAPGADPSPDARGMASVLKALVEAQTPELPPREEPGFSRLMGKLGAAAPDAAAFPAGVAPAAGAPAANRLARPEDWGSSAFLNMAYALFPSGVHDHPGRRTAWTWERAALGVNLDRAQPLANGPHVLVAAELPELSAFMLSNLGAQVDIADPRALAEGRLASVDFRRALTHDTLAVPPSAQPVGLIETRRSEIDAGFRYDAIVLPQNGLFARGRDGAAALLRQASRLLKDGGHLGFAAFAVVNSVDKRFYGDNVPLDLIRDGRLAALLAEAGLEAEGGVDARLTPAALDTLGAGEGGGDGQPALLLRDGAAIRAHAAFALRKTGPGGDDAWARVDQALRSGIVEGAMPDAASGGDASAGAEVEALQRLCVGVDWTAESGSLLRRLTAGEGAVKTPRSIRVSAEAPAGLSVYGVLGRLEPGAYELRLQGFGGAVSGPPPRAYVVSPEGVRASCAVLADGGAQWVIPFEALGSTETPMAFGLIAPGGVAFEVLDLSLD